MRVLLASLGALAVLSNAVRGQDVSFDLDFHPPAGDQPSVQWDAPDGPGGSFLPLNDFRIRVKGTEGTWVRPVLNFAVASSAPDSWEGPFGWMILNIDDRDGGDLALPTMGSTPLTLETNYHGINVPNAGSLERWFTRMLEGQTSGYSPSAVKAWAQPFVRPTGATGGLAQTSRLWTAGTPFWMTQAEGIQHGLFWRAIVSDASTTTTFNAFSALRLAVVEHALNTPGIGLQDVTNLFRSPEWTSVLEDGHLNLAIQLVAASATNFGPNPSFPTDPDVPDLTESAPIPSLSISDASKFIVTVPPQFIGGPTNIGEVPANPGQRLFFHFPTGRGPTVVAFKDVSGNDLVTTAYAFPQLFAPCLYALFVPLGAVSGAVKIKTGSMTSFEVVGHVQVP